MQLSAAQSKPGFYRVLFFVPSACVIAAVLAGCSASSSTLQGMVSRYVLPGDPLAQAQLDPRLRYLRVDTSQGGAALMALGYLDPVKDDPQGAPEEVWYSASKEVLRLRHGRLAGATGLPREWRDVSFSAVPSWRSVLERPSLGSYQRVRDSMPGALTGVKDSVTIRPIAPPGKTLVSVQVPASVQWFEEVAVTRPPAAQLPASLFAVDLSNGTERVVYSQQCLAADLCLALRPVTAAAPAPAAAASR